LLRFTGRRRASWMSGRRRTVEHRWSTGLNAILLVDVSDPYRVALGFEFATGVGPARSLRCREKGPGGPSNKAAVAYPSGSSAPCDIESEEEIFERGFRRSNSGRGHSGGPHDHRRPSPADHNHPPPHQLRGSRRDRIPCLCRWMTPVEHWWVVRAPPVMRRCRGRERCRR
jgi:hypothetical protein